MPRYRKAVFKRKQGCRKIWLGTNMAKQRFSSGVDWPISNENRFHCDTLLITIILQKHFIFEGKLENRKCRDVYCSRPKGACLLTKKMARKLKNANGHRRTSQNKRIRYQVLSFDETKYIYAMNSNTTKRTVLSTTMPRIANNPPSSQSPP